MQTRPSAVKADPIGMEPLVLALCIPPTSRRIAGTAEVVALLDPLLERLKA